MNTIIIPTKNRSDFLTRLLDYFADTNYMHWISIGDSSNAQHVQRIKETIKKLEHKLNITYHEYPGLSITKCAKELLQTVSTPYASLFCDDDFLVPNSLEKCIEFLELYPEYIACHGMGAIAYLKQSGPHAQFESICEYRLPSREEETASKRLINHLSNNSNVLFSVYRSNILKRLFKHEELPDKSISEDILPSCLAVIQGKFKKLNCFHIVHQSHDRQIAYVEKRPIRFYDWITSANWFPSYQFFYNTLSEELTKQDNISIDEAHAVVRQAFWSYSNYKSNKHFKNDYGNSGDDVNIKQNIKRIPGIKGMWNIVKNIQYKIHPSNHVTLPALLNPSSPYHADFMPIYRAITNPQQES